MWRRVDHLKSHTRQLEYTAASSSAVVPPPSKIEPRSQAHISGGMDGFSLEVGQLTDMM